ncbi:nitrate- and nitrite sensing domain-containing protein [Thiomicrorhabdus sp. 6S2-11]|uniref:Nitrate- and nitrite sensing domain-containing protein n=1 Tax=Thiomicrorhabdus marina TaxID=2818442 RepID=A0ABS3Q1H8_9GAMM|nr:nitrate regulatory protein [Thiomicrorhabdus marina]MBO1926151.1 nitrate- and nitrite sensing domain-containing protein [Thiomicrorhabdus marina]
MGSQNSIAKLWLASKKAEHQSLQMLFELSQLVGQLHKMIHYLQLERGSSVLYLASDGEIPEQINYRAFRNEFCQQRESFNKSLETWLESTQGKNLGGSVYINLAKALSVLQNELYQARRDIDARAISSIQAAEAISAVVKVLINVVVDMTELSQESKIAKLMISLIYIMKAKEIAGQERALGVYIVASGAIKDSDLANQRQSLVEMQQYYLTNFADTAPRSTADQYKKINGFTEIEQYREKFPTQQLLGMQAAQDWFAVSTQRIEMMQLIEDNLVQSLQLLCAKQLNQSDELLNQDQQWIDDVIGRELHQSGDVNTAGSTSMFMEKLTEQGQALKVTQQELAKTKQALLDQRVIQLAKSKLMKSFKLSEESAHRKMQQAAMEKGIKLAELANQIIAK